MARPIETVGKHMTANPLAIEKTKKLEEAQRLMREHGIRHLPVVDGGKLCGILSDRDVHLTRSLRAVDHGTMLVGDAMTPNPVSYTSTTPLKDVAQLMSQFRCGSILVVDQGRLVGIFTTVDALRVLADKIEENELLQASADRAALTPRVAAHG